MDFVAMFDLIERMDSTLVRFDQRTRRHHGTPFGSRR